jgi:hypothetical protein
MKYFDIPTLIYIIANNINDQFIIFNRPLDFIKAAIQFVPNLGRGIMNSSWNVQRRLCKSVSEIKPETHIHFGLNSGDNIFTDSLLIKYSLLQRSIHTFFLAGNLNY